MGVRDHTFLEDLQLPKFDFLRKIVALTMLQTGQELFYTTHESRDQSILYEMATQGKFVNALKAFQQRRLYANLQNDFLVPLGTAAFLTEQEVLEARSQYGHGQEAGIVGRRLFPDDAIRSSNLPKDEHHKIHHQMISSLNSCGWEKIFVHFPGVLPNAHNKICALQKYTPWIDRMLGFEEGRFVMDEASEWFQP